MYLTKQLRMVCSVICAGYWVTQMGKNLSVALFSFVCFNFIECSVFPNESAELHFLSSDLDELEYQSINNSRQIKKLSHSHRPQSSTIWNGDRAVNVPIGPRVQTAEFLNQNQQNGFESNGFQNAPNPVDWNQQVSQQWFANNQPVSQQTFPNPLPSVPIINPSPSFNPDPQVVHNNLPERARQSVQPVQNVGTFRPLTNNVVRQPLTSNTILFNLLERKGNGKVNQFNAKHYLPDFKRFYWIGDKYFYQDTASGNLAYTSCTYGLPYDLNIFYDNGDRVDQIMFQCIKTEEYCCKLDCCSTEIRRNYLQHRSTSSKLTATLSMQIIATLFTFCIVHFFV